MSTSRQKYLDAESAAGKELQTWLDQEPPGALFAHELALLKWQLSQAARANQGTLVRDLSNSIVAVEKTRRQIELSTGQLWSPKSRKQFVEQFTEAIERVLRDVLPDGDWQDALCMIADEYARICSGITAAQKALPAL